MTEAEAEIVEAFEEEVEAQEMLVALLLAAGLIVLAADMEGVTHADHT